MTYRIILNNSQPLTRKMNYWSRHKFSCIKTSFFHLLPPMTHAHLLFLFLRRCQFTCMTMVPWKSTQFMSFSIYRFSTFPFLFEKHLDEVGHDLKNKLTIFFVANFTSVLYIFIQYSSAPLGSKKKKWWGGYYNIKYVGFGARLKTKLELKKIYIFLYSLSNLFLRIIKKKIVMPDGWSRMWKKNVESVNGNK